MNYFSAHRTVKAPNLAEHVPLGLVPKDSFSEIPWTRGWTPRRLPGMPSAEWFRRDDERKAKRAKEKKELLQSKKREESRYLLM